jgi:hypothetical protein
MSPKFLKVCRYLCFPYDRTEGGVFFANEMGVGALAPACNPPESLDFVGGGTPPGYKRYRLGALAPTCNLA